MTVIFFLLLFALSVPFWLLGFLEGQMLPAQLPISAFQAVCPLMAAVILVGVRHGRGGIRELFKRVLCIRQKGFLVWYLLGFLTMPVVMLLAYAVMRMLGRPVPEPDISFTAVLAAFIVFFVAATAEETGWMGYVADPLLKRTSAWMASIILGAVWAIWHVIPYYQAGRSAGWIFWQCVFTVLVRILMVWLYNNSGRQVQVAILFHAMINVTYVHFPVGGSHYDPAIAAMVVAAFVAVVLFLWGGKTLTRFRCEAGS
jgi:hypothetical protein